MGVSMGKELNQELLFQTLYELGNFNGGLAHEINNPLAILVGQISLMKMMAEKNTLSPEKLAEKLDKLESATQRVIDIVDDMRKIPRSVSEKVLEPVALSKIIDVNSFLIAYPCKKFEIDFICSNFADDIFINCVWEEVVVVLNTLLRSCISSIKELASDKSLIVEIQYNQMLNITIKSSAALNINNELFPICQDILSRYQLELKIENNNFVIQCPIVPKQVAA